MGKEERRRLAETRRRAKIKAVKAAVLGLLAVTVSLSVMLLSKG